MLVFDASGSMAGNLNQGIATTKPRIEEVRAALKRVLPSITRFRRVGLIVYGPGPYQQCNVKLALKPAANAGERIMAEVNALTPAGKTPLTAAVADAADVLDYQNKPALIVVVTDGEETCGGSPCNLGKELHGKAERLTVHVIAFRVKDYSWTGEQSIIEREMPGRVEWRALRHGRRRAGPRRGAREDARLPDAFQVGQVVATDATSVGGIGRLWPWAAPRC